MFDQLKMLSQLGPMMAKAREMKTKMEEMQARLPQMKATGEAGGSLVTVVANGNLVRWLRIRNIQSRCGG
jgi:DNA-binding protein YbaB